MTWGELRDAINRIPAVRLNEPVLFLEPCDNPVFHEVYQLGQAEGDIIDADGDVIPSGRRYLC